MVASLRRWAARDPVGQRLFSFTDKLEAIDDKSFRLVLKEPYSMVLESLGKSGTSVPIIMREKEALTDPNTQITEAVGSGPFKFAKEQWVPGSKTVYLKNGDYVPRPGNTPLRPLADLHAPSRPLRHPPAYAVRVDETRVEPGVGSAA